MSWSYQALTILHMTCGVVRLADAAEDVLALTSAAIDVMPSESLRGALFCATDLLSKQREKTAAAVHRDEKEVHRLQQEVSTLASSLKVPFQNCVT